MRRRLAPLLVATVLAAGALWLNAVTPSTSVFACSCAPPPTLAEAAADPRQAIVVGTIGFTVGNDTLLVIERSFGPHPPPASELLIDGIGIHGAACQLGASAGERWLLVLHRLDDDGGFSTNSCSLAARLGTEFGDDLLGQAIEAFGGTAAAPSAEPAPPAAASPSFVTWLPGVGWAALTVAAGVAVLLGAVLVAGRRPQA